MKNIKNFFLPAILIVPLVFLAACSGVATRLLADNPQVRARALDEVLRSDDKTRMKAALRMKDTLARKKSPYRLYAVSALEHMGQSAAPAVPELMAALTDRDLVYFSAARTLAKLDAAAPALLEALKSKDPALRREAGQILPAQGALATPGLAKNLESPDPALAEESVRILAEMGPAAKDAIPALAHAAFSGGKDLKRQASIALGKIGPPAGKWLAAALKAPDAETRSEAAGVLADMYPPPPEAAVALAAALDDPDAGICASAAKTLGAYPAETLVVFPEDFISALFRAAQAPDEDAHIWASITLERIGAPAGKWLANALKAPAPAVRAGAALVVSRMFPPPAEAADAVLAALNDTDPATRRAAADALGTYAMTAPQLLPKTAAQKLGEALKNKDAALRSAVIFPLSRLASKNKHVMAALIGALADRDLEVKKSAVSSLGALGPAARKALPAIWENYKSRDCVLRELSAHALAQIDPALKKDPGVARTIKTQCPGVKTYQPLEPEMFITEKIMDTGTAQLLLPFAQELMKYSTGQLPAAP